ncbi:MAG: DMT family transporter [Anaerolineae bacterium]
MSIYLGEIAAILTAVCWTFTAAFFAAAGREVGSVVVNRMRLLLAVLQLALAHWLLYAVPFPVQAGPERWFWLGISGIVGLAIADAFLFQSYLWIGPRLGMLLMSGAPVIAALLAWIFLGETLQPRQVAGIFLTVGGIAWVVLERNGKSAAGPADPNFTWGILFGVGAATGQAIGLITAKKGLGGDFPALSGNMIRMVSAAVVMWSYTLARGRAGYTLRRFASGRKATLTILGGAFFGPFLGVSLSLVAIQLTAVGIASTLMALAPIFLLPVGRYLFNEQFGWAAIAGTLLATLGVVLLF